MSFFRDALTWLAALLIAALTAALAVPYLIDWSSRRGFVESLLSDALGAKVEVRGDIVVRLLPAPILDLRDISMQGAQSGDPRLSLERLRLEMAPAPLIRGAVRFVEASLERPRLTLTLTPQGALRAPEPPASAPAEVAFERVVVSEGAVIIERPGAPAFVLDGVNLNAEAAGLRGPFRAAGSLRVSGRERAVRFVSGAFEDGRIRVKASAEGRGAPTQADVDGLLFINPSPEGARLRFEGPAAFGGALEIDGASVPWRVVGQASLEPGLARLEPMEARLGPEERPATLAGLALYDEGRGALVLRLTAQQLDLDRLLAEDAGAQQAERAAARVARLFGEAMAGAGEPGRPIDVEIDALAVQIGGDLLNEAHLRYDAQAGALAVSAQLPGRARLSLDGRVETGAAARFSGEAAFSLRDRARLAEWTQRFDAELAERLRALPFASLEAQGRVEASRAALAVRDLTARADRSTFNGAAAYTRALPGERARLFADLTSPALDLETLPDLTGAARASADMDLNLSFDARAVRLARVGGGVVDAGRINLKLLREGESMRLERLALDELGGANLRASGRLDAQGARLEGSLDAQRLGELAALMRRIAPGALADAFAERATALSPARLTIAAEASPRAGALDLRSLRIDGSARGTRVVGVVRPTGERIDGEIEFLSADAPMLLRQFGLDAAPVPGLRARVFARTKGSRAEGYELNVSGEVAGSEIGFDGRVTHVGETLAAEGAARLRANDSAPLLRALALPAPEIGQSAALDARARLAWREGALEARELAGAAMGANFSGALRYARAQGETKRALAGALALDGLSMGTLTSLALGSPRAAKAGAPWSDQPFAPAPPLPFPMRIALSAQTLDLRVGGQDVRGQDARMELALEQGLVAVENFSLRMQDGAARARATIRRDGADVSLSGKLEMDLALAGRFDLDGRLGADLELAASGRSEASLVGNLAGGGSVRLSGARAARLDAGALSRVVAAAEADAIAADERAIAAAFAREFDRGALRLEDLRFDAVIASGALRVQPARAQTSDGALEAVAAGLFDLRSWTGETSLDLQARAAPKDWSGPAPRVRVVWNGPADKPARAIDANALSAALTSRALVRESARIAALEADIRERAAFNRRLRAQDWLRQRAAEIEFFVREEERKRLDAEARAKALDEETRRAAQEEEKRRQAEALRLRREQEAREAQQRAGAGAPMNVTPRAPAPAPNPAPAPRAAPKEAPSDPIRDFLKRFGVGAPN